MGSPLLSLPARRLPEQGLIQLPMACSCAGRFPGVGPGGVAAGAAGVGLIIWRLGQGLGCWVFAGADQNLVKKSCHAREGGKAWLMGVYRRSSPPMERPAIKSRSKFFPSCPGGAVLGRDGGRDEGIVAGGVMARQGRVVESTPCTQHPGRRDAMLRLFTCCRWPWKSASMTAPAGAMCRSRSGATRWGALGCWRNAPVGIGGR